jgi:hypothetical protein
MNFDRLVAECSLDGFHICVNGDVEYLEGVKGLQALNAAHHLKIQIPKVPEESAADDSEDVAPGPDGLASFLFFAL